MAVRCSATPAYALRYRDLEERMTERMLSTRLTKQPNNQQLHHEMQGLLDIEEEQKKELVTSQ